MPKKKSTVRAREAASTVGKPQRMASSDPDGLQNSTPAMMLLSPYAVPTMPSSPSVEPMQVGEVAPPASQDRVQNKESYQVASRAAVPHTCTSLCVVLFTFSCLTRPRLAAAHVSRRSSFPRRQVTTRRKAACGCSNPQSAASARACRSTPGCGRKKAKNQTQCSWTCREAALLRSASG